MLNRYPKGSHKICATERSIIANDEFKDRICKGYMSGYNLVH